MHLVSSICLLFLHQIYSSVSSMTDNRNLGNYNDTQPYVVGILSPSTTLYIDQGPPPDNNENSPVPPSDLNLERRNTNSFQITSVTVQGSRKHDDLAEDSCDDLDESHTDDLSSDMLDSSRADNEGGYHSEDNLCDDLSSPCGPIIWQLPTGNMVDRNMNLSIGVTPTFAAIGPVAGGVTMMTSKSESPISAQVPIMNPLPNNWQRRFKVVKIMSSEPFRRGRWLCMDFKDPPADVENESPKPEMNGTPPAIQITNFDDSEEHREHLLAMENFAQVYEIPINQTFSGNYIMSSQQHMYGIILPQNEYVQPVTLVQDLSLQTTDRNFNNLVNHQSILVQADPYGTPPNHPMLYSPPVGLVNNNSILNQSPPATQIVDSNYVNPSEAVLNQINASGNNGICDNTVVPPTLPRSRNNSNSHRIPPHVLGMDITIGGDAEETESFAFLDDELSRTSGLLSQQAPSPVFGMNGNCYSPVLLPRVIPKRPPTNPVVFPPPPTYVADCSATAAAIAPATTNAVVTTTPIVVEVKSSQSAPEKLPSSEVGQEVDPSAGSAAPTGANTVAIDNKIEQAMDLVKSHLMFAVREEVEVLKEKITELLERISQLEHENDILRANASAETLKQLNNQSHKKTASGGTTGKPSPVGPIPPPST